MSDKKRLKSLEKIDDEETRNIVLSILDENKAIKEELETARATTATLIDDNERLRAINTDLYAKSISGYYDNEPKDEEKNITIDDAMEDIAKTLMKGK